MSPLPSSYHKYLEKFTTTSKQFENEREQNNPNLDEKSFQSQKSFMKTIQ